MKHIKHYFQSKGCMWSKRQNSTFSEHSHVAYQTKENDKCSMVANILPADKYPMRLNNLVSMIPNYFIFIGYLRKMRYNQQSESNPFIHMNPLSRNPGSTPVLLHMNKKAQTSTDQFLCCSLIRKYDIQTCYMQSFNYPASLCS